MLNKISNQTRRKWAKRVVFCLEYQNLLTDWELGFIEKMDILLDQNVDLSLRRSFKLGEIFKRVEGVVG